VDRGDGKADVREYKGPPAEVETHLAHAEEHGCYGECAEPEGDEPEE
jgi:hypothetical protein